MTFDARSMHQRRRFLGQAAAAGLSLSAAGVSGAEPRLILRPMTLGFSLYGMKSLALPEALKACREIGYDCFELPVMGDWPADAARLTAAARREPKKQIEDSGLRLSALMENLLLLADDAQHRKNLDRLKLAAELAHELAPDRPPLIETVLGGRPDQWPQVKEQMAKRLEDWEAIAERAKFILAIKPHVSGALHRPDDAVWLARRVASEQLKLVFDYSHFQVQGLELEDCLRTMLPHSAFVLVKDAAGEPGKVRFLLPGKGKTDYVVYLRELAIGRYAGDVVVEVSSQISSRPDYDPIAAAKSSFAVLDSARKKIPRHL
jgi:inosose dehydratase